MEGADLANFRDQEGEGDFDDEPVINYLHSLSAEQSRKLSGFLGSQDFVELRESLRNGDIRMADYFMKNLPQTHPRLYDVSFLSNNL
jgi:hypothetical protein